MLHVCVLLKRRGKESDTWLWFVDYCVEKWEEILRIDKGKKNI